MKRFAASPAPTTCRARSKKYCLKMFGSRVLPDLLWIGGVEHVKLGEARDLAESHSHHFGTQVRPAHAKQERVREAARPNILGNAPEVAGVGQLVLGNT